MPARPVLPARRLRPREPLRREGVSGRSLHQRRTVSLWADAAAAGVNWQIEQMEDFNVECFIVSPFLILRVTSTQ